MDNDDYVQIDVTESELEKFPEPEQATSLLQEYNNIFNKIC